MKNLLPEKNIWRYLRNLRLKKMAVLAGALFLPLAVMAADEKNETPLDPVTGMKMTGDWELVRNNCIACHSAQQFLRQKGTSTTWTEIIRWMQKEGGLWPLDPETEKNILNYLTQNYGPSDAYRRAPIPATLMPVNPYVSNIKKEVEEKQKAGLIPSSANGL